MMNGGHSLTNGRLPHGGEDVGGPDGDIGGAGDSGLAPLIDLSYSDSEVPSPHRSSDPFKTTPLGIFNKNGLVRIDISDESDGKDQSQTSQSTPAYPKEPKKLALGIFLFCVAGFSNDLVLSVIHERIPETGPLPDLFFSWTPYVSFALVLSEYLLISSGIVTVLVCILHKYRWIVFRRVFFITSLLYFGRSVTMLVTQVPVADRNYYCAPKLNETNFLVVVSRALSLVIGLGLKVNGRHTLCGDYIYSGHTIILCIAYLVTAEYSPRRCWLLQWVVFLMSVAGMVCLLLSRGHYTIDVIISYWISTRVFWLYHTMAASPALKEYSSSNQLSRLYWFSLFRYMESSFPGSGPLPRRFDWPFPWPKSLSFSRPKSNLH